MHCKMLLAIAFVPVSDVYLAYATVEGGLEDEEFDKVLDYFEENYIGRMVRGRRNVARFPLEMWNCYDRVLNEAPNTNNAVEAFNNVLGNQSANCKHPGFYKFLDVLKKEQAMQRRRCSTSRLARLLPGNLPTSRSTTT